MSKEYIVIATSNLFEENPSFYCVIDCGEYAINDYVENLRFKDRITLSFFSLSDLIDTQLSISNAQKTITMNNEKSLYNFKKEVETALKELGIKDSDCDDEDD